MSIGTILVGIALLVGVTAYIAQPLFDISSKRNRGDDADLPTPMQLTAHRDAIYALIRELDADRQTGKVNTEDYEKQRAGYVAEGVAILKKLDALSSHGRPVEMEDQIEARVSALRRSGSAPAFAPESAESRFCTQCGRPIDPEDRFCAGCGTALKGKTA